MRTTGLFCPYGRHLRSAPLWGAFSLSASLELMLRVRARFARPEQPLCRVGNVQVPVGIDFPLNSHPALLLVILIRNQGVASIRSRNSARAVDSMRLSPARVIRSPRESAMGRKDNPAGLEQFSFPVEESARVGR